MLRIKTISTCAYKALVDTIDHDGIEHAGYLAFLAVLCIFPFLVFFFATVGFFGQTELGLKLISIIMDSKLIPADIITAMQPRFEEIASGPPQGLLTIAIVGAIWTASSSVDGLRTILNRAYRVGTPPSYLLRRLMSIAEFLIITAIIILIIIALVVAPNIWQHVQHTLHLENINREILDNPMWIYVRYGITTLSLFFIVSLAYIILPNTKQSWKAVAPGALVVILAWFVAGYLFSAYLNNFPQVSIIYGSLGGFIAALLFFYITAMIFIYGAEFNYHLEKAQGHKIEEKEHVEEDKELKN